MADLHKLLFETPAKISDREVLATARLNARVKAFAGQQLTEDVIEVELLAWLTVWVKVPEVLLVKLASPL